MTKPERTLLPHSSRYSKEHFRLYDTMNTTEKINFQRWVKHRKSGDPMFHSEEIKRKYERAMGATFIPFDKLEDEDFPTAYVGLGTSRIVPALNNSQALKSYPRCPKTGLLYPFAYK
jgi:hypothetical protein